MKDRIYFLDNLRTFLILLVVLIHCGIVYESVLESSWIVVDPVKSNGIGLLRMYLDIFVMFTLFFISGYFLPISIQSKSTKTLIISKFNRLIIPWLFALLTLIPIYKIIFLYSRGLAQEPWYSYFHIFNRPGGDPYFFADNPVMNWLWFLPILFIFQMLYLIIVKSRKSPLGLTIKKAALLVFILGVGYAFIISLTNHSGWYHSAILHFQNERLLPYFLIFLLGTISQRNRIFSSAFLNKKSYLWSNLILTGALIIFTAFALNLFFNTIEPSRNYYFLSAAYDKGIYHLSFMTSMMAFLYILLYLFSFYGNSTSKILSALNKNSYYVYIIHVVILGILGTLFLHIQLPAVVKFLLLSFTTFVLSNLLVSAYRNYLQRLFSHNSVSVFLIIATLTISFFVYSNQSGISVAEGRAVSQSIASGVSSMGLHEAALKGNLTAIKKLIEVGSDMNIKDPATGNNPLHTAAAFGQTEAAKMLIEGGTDVNFLNLEGATPLHTAAFFCHKEIVEALLLHGADKHIRNKDGNTALDNVSSPFEEVVEIYEFCDKTYGPLGMKIDLEYLKKARPEMADILK